jgi:hypothetical protein
LNKMEIAIVPYIFMIFLHAIATMMMNLQSKVFSYKVFRALCRNKARKVCMILPRH